MKKGLIIVVSLVMVTVMLFAGCSSMSTETTNDSAEYYAEEPAYDKMESEGQSMDTAVSNDMDDMAADSEQAYDEGSADGTGIDIDGNSSVLEPSVERKIIYTGNISARTKNFDEDYDMIMDSVKKAGGYIENAYVYGTEPEEWQDEGRYAEITIRVPSDKFDEFIDMLKGVGETTNSSVSGRDISLQYFDIETRLENLRIREERLQELLEQAASLEDIIELERELANVSYEIQSYEIEKRNYDSLIDFSQIYVSTAGSCRPGRDRSASGNGGREHEERLLQCPQWACRVWQMAHSCNRSNFTGACNTGSDTCDSASVCQSSKKKTC